MIPLVTIAKLHARPGREEDARAALHEVQISTHDEPGCRLYALHVDESDPGAFVMVEGWDSDEAMDAHVAAPYLQALIAKSEALFAGPVEVQRLVALPNGDSAKGQL